ncbi:MAG TPA: hypothetical protein VN521_02460 [Negativicutes bacterium]|nr:hypothetical protein [Negativicutes bacterium]
MRALIIGWLVLGLLLAATAHILGPYLDSCGEDDTAYAREYAGEMLLLLEQMSVKADTLAGTPAAARDHYLDAAAELGRRKQAAVHLKGDLAYDFVFAFACAEEWCRASAAAISGPEDAADRRRTRAALARAQAEFTAISTKDYKSR